MTSSVDFENRTTAFTNWLWDRGVHISPKVEVHDLRREGQGRALVAIQDIEADESLFNIPREILLNAKNNSLKEKCSSIEQSLGDLTQWEALILILMFEWKVMNEKSSWAPYFAVLPICDLQNYQFNQLIHWSDQEIENLKPSYIVNRIGKDTARSTFDRIKSLIDKFGIDELRNIEETDFHFVASLIMSYSFDVNENKKHSEQHDHPHEHEDEDEESEDEDEESEDEESDIENDQSDTIAESNYLKSMVPLADTLNADTGKHNASLNITKNQLVMRSIKKISKGEQIYNTYSDHPNAEILRRYGYVEQQGSQADFAEVSLEAIKRYFNLHCGLSPQTLEDIFKSLLEIQQEEDEEFVLDTYDCYVTSEVIPEMLFIIQLLTVLASVSLSTPFQQAEFNKKDACIKRVFKKTYQLLEAGKVTDNFTKNFEGIIRARMAEYDEIAASDFEASKSQLTREEMSLIVKKSEYKSLKNCLQVDKVLKSGEQKYSLIADEKILKNILKKDLFASEGPLAKKQKRDTKD